MSSPQDSRPLGQRIAGPLAQMWAGGAGPTGTSLNSAFRTAGLEPNDVVGTKEDRVAKALGLVDDITARTLISDLVDLLQMDGAFESDDFRAEKRIKRLREIFERVGAELSSSGSLQWEENYPTVLNASLSENTPPEKNEKMPLAYIVSPPGQPKRNVFLVHGRDHEAKEELTKLLRAFDLRIVDWTTASNATKKPSPNTDEIIDAGMSEADAIVVLFTPDDLGQCKPDLLQERDGADERSPTGQARLNVIFEAGMAWARYRELTVMVEVGPVREMSDLRGLNMLRLDGSYDRRKAFRDRLRNAGLTVDDDNSEWTSVGTFH